MDRRVTTTDGVVWQVRRLSPFVRLGAHEDDVIVEQKDHIGFEALFMILLTLILLLATPILVQSEYWWFAAIGPALACVTWFMYLAKWQVQLLREGTIVHRTHVRGRRPAAQLVSELAEEIARTPDKKLHP